jgi:hypothetical protein
MEHLAGREEGDRRVIRAFARKRLIQNEIRSNSGVGSEQCVGRQKDKTLSDQIENYLGR